MPAKSCMEALNQVPNNNKIIRRRKTQNVQLVAAQSKTSRAMDIPSRMLIPTLDFRFRFRANNVATAYSITSKALCTMMAIGDPSPVSYVNLFPLFAEVRLKSVEVWSPWQSGAPISPKITVTRTVEDGTVRQMRIVEDQTINPSVPAYIKYVPKQGESAFQWMSYTDSGSQFQLYAPQFSVIDVHVSARLQVYPGTTPGATSSNITAYPTVGYSPLDVYINIAGSRILRPEGDEGSTIVSWT